MARSVFYSDSRQNVSRQRKPRAAESTTRFHDGTAALSEPLHEGFAYADPVDGATATKMLFVEGQDGDSYLETGKILPPTNAGPVGAEAGWG